MICPTCFKQIDDPVVLASMVYGQKKSGVTIWSLIFCPHCNRSFNRILTRNAVRAVSRKWAVGAAGAGREFHGR